MSKLNNVKIFNSPITKEVYLCSINSRNIITEKRKLNEDDIAEFIFGTVIALESKYGSDIRLEDDKLSIEIKKGHKLPTRQHEDKGDIR